MTRELRKELKPGSRECAVADVQQGDFIEFADYGDLHGEVLKIIELDKTIVGDGKTDWYTFHVQPHDPEWPHNSLPVARVVVGPKRGTDTVVSWS